MFPRLGADRRSIAGRFDPFCRVAYELGLLLAVLTLVLSAVHGAATAHAVINETIDSTHFRTQASPGEFIVGRTYPVYRFHPEWQQTIGHAKAEQISGDTVTFQFDLRSFRWPLGRQGRVTDAKEHVLQVNLGSRQGFAVGNRLNIFDGLNRIGTIQLGEVGPNQSKGQLVLQAEGSEKVDLGGKTASEYLVATQVVSFNALPVSFLDVSAYSLLLLGYLVGWLRFRTSPMEAIFCRFFKNLHPGFVPKMAFHAFVGIPVTYVLVDFFIHAVVYLASLLDTNFIHWEMPTWLNYPTFQVGLIPLTIVLILIYEGVLWKTRVSPFALIARRVAFRGGLYGREARDFPEHLTMWLLQLVIVFTFGRTLTGFFQGNMNAAIAASWPQAPAVIVPQVNSQSLEGFMRTVHALGYAFTHRPHPASEDQVFSTIRNFINDACIVGGLFGYLYTVVGYLWGKRVRNVDFTVAAWLVNAVCYGPLFGVVLWQMLPSQIGLSPTVVPGGFRTTTFIVEMIANIFYTMSIWNLGVMFGLMTDKGLRTTGFYSVVRHPSYTLEALMFALVFCRGLSSVAQWYAMAWFFITYWIRSEREEQFMRVSNPGYNEYRANVRYKFIPGIF